VPTRGPIGPGVTDIFDPSLASDDRDDALRAWLNLQASLYLDPVRAAELVRRTGDPAAALRLAQRRPPLDRAQLDARVELLRDIGAKALPLASRRYPARLRVLSDAAPLLLIRGNPEVLNSRGVAIVGARAATVYGLEVARRLAGELAAAGVVVISGLARGIDAAAHRGALAAGGRTLAFSACGPERIYPAQHRLLASQICERGAIVTEMPPGTAPRPAYFPLRNRLIAALAELVVVVEARVRSGSLVTARLALDQGGEVMAVPGPITAATSRGPNLLLRDGAAPVLGAGDVLQALGLEPPVVAGSGGAAPAPRPDRQGRVVLARLEREPASRDDLARALGWSIQQLAVVLMELELAGRVRLDRDGLLRALAAR
jgi:DNA processing protein